MHRNPLPLPQTNQIIRKQNTKPLSVISICICDIPKKPRETVKIP